MNGSLVETNNSVLLSVPTADFELNAVHEYLYGGLWGKIGYYFIIFICHIIGPILLSGIIIFETFGGDPQKRNVINRLLSLCCTNAILLVSLNGVCKVWRDLFGLIYVEVMIWIEGFGQILVINVLFFFNEMTILRFLYIVVWKRVKGFDDRFWTLFLCILTYSWTFCLAVINKHHSEVNLVPLKLVTANLDEAFSTIR